jgi:signal transduction histidine kinase
MIQNNEIEQIPNDSKLNALFGGLISSVSVGSLIAAFLTYYLYADIPDLIFWLILNLIGAAWRLRLFYSYNKTSDKYTNSKWLRLYHYSTCFIASTWAIVVLVLSVGIPANKELVVVAIIVGLITGGAISNIANKVTAYYYSSSIIGAYIIKTLIVRDPYYIEFSVSQLLFLSLLFKMIKSFNLLYEDAQKASDSLKDKLYLEKELQSEKIKTLQSSKLASLGEMATGVAHEINNPLTVGIGKLEILKMIISKDVIDKEKAMEHIDSIQASSKRISNIVFSMKNLSRIKDEVELQEFTINDLIEIVKPLFFSKLRLNEVTLIEQFDDITLHADKGEISQVFLNLVNNSVDAIKNSSGEKWIRLSTEVDSEFVTLNVTDSGQGISEHELEKIFEPFYTTKDIGEGTGLGLSLSKNIMIRNGGDLDYNPKSLNTSFSMRIKVGHSNAE